MPTEVHDCDRSTWFGAPGDQRICPECHQVWVALDAGPLDIRGGSGSGSTTATVETRPIRRRRANC